MGSIVCGIHAFCGSFHRDAGVVALSEDGDEIGTYIPGKNIILHRIDDPGLHFISQADDGAGVSGRERVIDAVMISEPHDKVRGGNVFGEIKVGEIGAQNIFLGRGQFGDPGKRGSRRDRKGICESYVVGLGSPGKVKQDFIDVVVFQEGGTGKTDIVCHSAGDQQSPVAVQDISSGGGDGFRHGIGADQLVRIPVLNQLQTVHFYEEYHHYGEKKQEQDKQSARPKHFFHPKGSFQSVQKGAV